MGRWSSKDAHGFVRSGIRQAAALALLVVSMLLLPPAALAAFPDVPEGHPHADAIDKLASAGIISGYQDGRFGPADPVKRAQFAKMITGTLSIPVAEQLNSPFTDLGPDNPDDLYPHEYVAAAYLNQITTGKTATSFAPYEAITRAQVITMVVRALDRLYPGLLRNPPADFQPSWNHFSDIHSPNARRAEYNNLLMGLGRDATHPAGNLGALDPWSPMSRAEVARVLATTLLMRPVSEADVEMSAADTAAALTDPERSEAGVWSVIANLNIGVYTPVGGRLLAGSESYYDDFLLLDYEVPVLVGAAGELGPTTDELHQMLEKMGVEITLEEFLSELRALYLGPRSDRFLDELFQAAGLEFVAGEQLTSFEAWLIFLDLLVPQNGSPEMDEIKDLRLQTEAAVERQDVASLSAAVVSGLQPQAVDLCQRIQDAVDKSGWGGFKDAALFLKDLISKARKVAKAGSGPAAVLDPVEGLKALTKWLGAELDVKPTKGVVHEKHPENSTFDESRFTLTAKFNPGLVPPNVISCLRLLGEDVPPAGRISGLGVEWRLDPILEQHGTFKQRDGDGSWPGGGMRVLTDNQGQTHLDYTVLEEQAKGEGFKRAELGTVAAVVRVQNAALLNMFAGAQEMLAPRRVESTLWVEWHETPWNLAITWASNVPGVDNVTYRYSFDFSVEEDGSLQGHGICDVSGWVILYPDGVSKVKATVTGRFDYLIDAQNARRVTSAAYAGPSFEFLPEAFVPVGAQLTIWGGSPDLEEALAASSKNMIQALIVLNPLGKLVIPAKAPYSATIQVVGVSEPTMAVTLTTGSKVAR